MILTLDWVAYDVQIVSKWINQSIQFMIKRLVKQVPFLRNFVHLAGCRLTAAIASVDGATPRIVLSRAEPLRCQASAREILIVLPLLTAQNPKKDNWDFSESNPKAFFMDFVS